MRKLLILFTLIFALAATNAAHAEKWELDKAHTEVKFKVRHLLTDVWGEFTEYDASVIYDPENPSRSEVEVTVDVSSIDTGVEKRDQHLRSDDFFHVEKYPKMTFASKKVERVARQRHQITGDLTIRGVTREIVLNVGGPSAPIEFMGTTKVSAHAEATVNRTEFGLIWNRTLETGGLLVGEEVTIVIDAELNKVQKDEN